jgi:hypothetical protein
MSAQETNQEISQENNIKYKNQIRITYGYMNNHIFRIEPIEDAGWMQNGPAFEYGLSYSYPMDEKLWMGIGLNYLSTTNTFHSAVTLSEEPYSTEQTSKVFYLPVYWQYDISDWFAVKFGLSIEIAISDSDFYNQNGLGFMGGTVTHYSPNSRFDFGLEPKIHLTSMLPIPQEFHQQHFFLAGINTFVAFRL